MVGISWSSSAISQDFESTSVCACGQSNPEKCVWSQKMTRGSFILHSIDDHQDSVPFFVVPLINNVQLSRGNCHSRNFWIKHCDLSGLWMHICVCMWTMKCLKWRWNQEMKTGSFILHSIDDHQGSVPLLVAPLMNNAHFLEPVVRVGISWSWPCDSQDFDYWS
jgi:hypothetical protein